MTLLKLVLSLTLLCAVTGFPSSGKRSVALSSVSDVAELAGSAGTGKNWLTPYVSLLSSVIPLTETVASIPAKSGKATRDSRSSDRAEVQRKPGSPPPNPFCPKFTLNHEGKNIPLIRPTTGNIYKNKSNGDPEQLKALSAALAAVAAHSSVHRDAGVISISNPEIRRHPKVRKMSSQEQLMPRRLDVCSSVWSAASNPQRGRREVELPDYLYAYFSTLSVPSASTSSPTTPMTPLKPIVEAVVTKCDLPQDYHDDRYDWLEILAGHGGLPGCVNAMQLPAVEEPAPVLNETCNRPLNKPGVELYSYEQSDTRTFYRYETAKMMFPGKPNQFFEVQGYLVWTSPPDDGNVYIVEYKYDDSGLWVLIPEKTCKFVDTATLTCSWREDYCTCRDDKKICVGGHGLPGNLLSTLVGGG